MENKLQEILKWLVASQEWQVDALYQVLIKENLYFINEIVDNDVYEKFMKEIIEEAKPEQEGGE